MSKKKPEREELRLLLLEGTNLSVAEKLKVHPRTIQRWRNIYKLDHKTVVLNGHIMSEFQTDIIIGTLLGDASIPCQKNSCLNRYCFGQKSDRIEYVQFILEALKPYSKKIYHQEVLGPSKINGEIIQNSGKLCKCDRFYTIFCEEFMNMRKEWYLEPYKKKSLKIIPNIQLNWNRFFFWFADDGNNNVAKKTITLSTNCFIEEDVKKLINIIERDLSIKGNIRNWGTGFLITFGASEYQKIMNNLQIKANDFKLEKTLESKLNTYYAYDYKKYISSKSTKEELEIYKKRKNNIKINEILKFHKISHATMYRIIKKYSEQNSTIYPSGYKLTEENILEIISLWNKGLSQSKIANQFKIAQTMVSQIVRRKSRQSITEKLWIRNHTPKDTSNITVVYNPL